MESTEELKHINLDSLSRKEALSFYWATFWRGLIIALGGSFSGYVIGTIGSIIWIVVDRTTDGAFKAPMWLQVSIELPFVLGISAYLGWQGWRWLFHVKLAGFKLCLVRIKHEL